MLLRTAAAIAVLLTAVAGSAQLALAQYYPPPPSADYRRPLPPPIEADDEDDGLAPLDRPSIFGRPLPPPQVIQPRPLPPPQYGSRGPDYPQTDPYGPPPPGAVYRQDYPPASGHDLDPRSRPDYGALPAPGQPTYEDAPVPGQQPAYGAQPPAPGQQQDAVRPPLSIGPDQQMSSLPPDIRPEVGPARELPPQFRRTTVDYRTKEPAGTIIIDTPNTYLYLVLGNGKAMRYGIGVGREGFTWAGAEKVSRMAEWPDWHPPAEMIERQPYLPRFMAGGEGNPLGARALYLGKTLYRIHGTNQPSTIGTFVSSGCIRLTNEDITDLYYRVNVGTRVVVLPGKPPATASAATPIAPQADQTPPQGPYNPLAPPPTRVR